MWPCERKLVEELAMADNLEAVVAGVVVGSVVVAMEYDGHHGQSSGQHQVGLFRCQV